MINLLSILGVRKFQDYFTNGVVSVSQRRMGVLELLLQVIIQEYLIKIASPLDTSQNAVFTLEYTCDLVNLALTNSQWFEIYKNLLKCCSFYYEVEDTILNFIGMCLTENSDLGCNFIIFSFL